MKIIDEKGKVFGKINIIDLVVVLFVICFIPSVFYFGYKNMIQKKLPKIAEQKVIQKTREKFFIDESRYIEVNGVLFGSNPEIVKRINKGDKELDSNKNVIAEIIDVGKPEKVLRKINLGKENTVMEATALGLRLRLKTVTQNNHFMFKEKALLLDQPFEFNTPQYTLNIFFKGLEEKEKERKVEESIKGSPKERKVEESIKGSPKDRKVGETIKRSVEEKRIDIPEKTIYKTIKLRVKAPQILPEVAELITVGDKEYVKGTTKYDQIFVLGEVSSIKNISYYKLVTIQDGKKQVYERTDLRVAELILDLKVEEKDNQIMYKNYAIKTGQTFLFETSKYNLNCLVLEVLK